MLNDAAGFEKVYLATGRTDLRCGRQSTKIKGLVWEGDGFLLIYKRLNAGAFSWPGNSEEAMQITTEQYRLLMEGFDIVAKRPISETHPKELL